jgi:hypothetical protein
MKEFDPVVSDLPYKESPDYVDRLVARCKAEALKQVEPASRVVRPWIYCLAGVAAAAAIALGVFFSIHRTSPMDKFLASLSDEEAAMIVDWTIDDIPELY